MQRPQKCPEIMVGCFIAACRCPVHALLPLHVDPSGMELHVQLAVGDRHLSNLPYAPALVKLLTVVPQLLDSRLDLALHGLKLLSCLQLHARSTWMIRTAQSRVQVAQDCQASPIAQQRVSTSCFTISSRTALMGTLCSDQQASFYVAV
jgi:hypothetical protein